MGSSTLFLSEDKLREKSDYHGWKMSLDLTLEDQEVLDHVRGNVGVPPSNASAAARSKWTKGEFKAKKIIRDSIDKRLVAYVSKMTTSKEIYDRLVSLFKLNDANQVLFLRNKLKEIKKGKDESMQAYFLRITEIKNDLLSIGEVVLDREMTITTLGGLRPEWYIFRTTLLNNNVILGFEELMARCIQEETRMEEQEMPTLKCNPSAFSSHGKRRNNSGAKSKGKAGSKGGRKGRCYNCNKIDHYARECPDKRDSHHDDDQNHSQGNQRNGRSNGRGKRNAGNQGRGQPFKKARNCRYESNVVNNKQDEYCLPADLSTTAPPDSLGNWLIDSGASRHFTGYKEALSNLIEKETNLEIVLGDNTKYSVKGVGNVTLQLIQGNTIHLQEVLYVLDLKKNLVSVLAMEDKGYKVTFIDGKGSSKGDHSPQAKARPPIYCSWFTQTYLDEVFTWFRHFKALIENQIEKKIKILRTDNGTEYESNKFHDFCKEAGIKRETTTPYTPEQNGVEERKNRTIVEAVRVMLHDQRLPKFLWVEAVNSAVYVQNR
eukprot:PITA_15808